MQVKLAKRGTNIDPALAVLHELRSHYTPRQLKRAVERQLEEGFHLAWVEDNGEVLCVAGFVIANKLAWGKHVYVDDLVTNSNARSKGAGAFMIDWLKQHARERGCGELHLDSGVQRFAAHKFYLREGFAISSHHFSMTLESA